MEKRRNIFTTILSILLSMFSAIGYSFFSDGDFSFIAKHIVLSIITFIVLFIIFNFLLNKLYKHIDKKKYFKEEKDRVNNLKVIKLFKKYPFIFSLIFILICYIPYIVAYYPAILSPDPSFQIRQYFDIPNKYSTYSVLIDENVIITNHHPVVHTLLLGSLTKVGVNLGNVNVGLFLYSIIQILLLSSTLAFTIKYLSKQNVSLRYLIICLLAYAFVPVFPFYSMSIQKDVFFGCFIILYNIMIYDFIKYKKPITFKRALVAIILMILIILFRNNGFYVLLLTLPFLLLIDKKNRVKIAVIIVTVIGFNFCYNDLILPYFKITPTSIREALSIPFQQTARYVKEGNVVIDEDEKEAIDKLIKYDTLSERYNPELSDPVKKEFNRFYTKEDLSAYFKAWFKGLKKDPITYVEATINNTYGYFFPLKTNWYIYYRYDKRLSESGFDYHFNDLNELRTYLSVIGNAFPYVPLLNLFVNIGFNTWLILIMTMYLLYKKKYKYLIYLLPSLVLILICVASPANTYFRYVLPYVFSMPLLVGLFLDLNKKND